MNEQFCAQATHTVAHEGRRDRETNVTYSYDDKKARYVERDMDKNTTVGEREIDIPACVHEIIGGLYKLREMRLAPGQTVEIPISDGKKAVRTALYLADGRRSPHPGANSSQAAVPHRDDHSAIGEDRSVRRQGTLSVRHITGLCRLSVLAVVLVTVVWAQDRPLLDNRAALALFKRTVQLMESTAIAVPELARAGAPVTENARQALLNLEKGVNDHAGHTYNFLLNLKAYLALADSVPKPFPFPGEARKQFAELRENQARADAHFAALLDAKEIRLRSPDRDNLRRYADSNAKLGSPVPGRPRIVFLGDSITDGWRLNEYFPDRDFVNRGISGQVTGEMLGRMKADVIDLKPAGMLVLGGTNDLARGIAIEAIQNNLWMIANLAAANNIKPTLPSTGFCLRRLPQQHDRLRGLSQGGIGQRWITPKP
jgi:hypothetical protein